MKIKRVLAIMALHAIILNVTAEENVVITGNLSAIPDSTEVILMRTEGRVRIDIAVDTIINGNFRLSFPVDSGLTKAELCLSKDHQTSRYRTLYLRPDAKIEINVSNPFVQTWNVKSNVPEQNEYDRFITESKEILNLLQQDNGFSRYVLAASNIKTKPSSESNSNESLCDSLTVVTMLRDMELLQQMPVTEVWLDKMENLARSVSCYEGYSDILKGRLQNLYQNLNESEKNSRQAAITNVILNPPAEFKIGDEISDEEFIDINGNRHKLSELRDKWVLLDFWRSGCYSSIMAFPELKKFEEENANQIVVVSLSMDNEKMWKWTTENLVKIDVNNWNEGKEDMGLFQKFGADGTPTFVLLSPEGVVKGKWMLYSQGSFGRQFKLFSREKGRPEYVEIDDTRYIKNPEYNYNETLGRIDVESVHISEKGTKIEFFANGSGITISPYSFLLTNDGTRLMLIGSDGTTPGQEVKVDENGTGIFSLTYEPLPKDTKSFTFVEEPGGWLSIKNIHVKK